NGLVQTITDPIGRVVTHTFDTAGRLTDKAVAAPAGVAAPVGTIKQHFDYDGAGRIVAATDDNGGNPTAVKMRWDSAGNLIEDTQTFGATVTAGTPQTVSAPHDKNGRLKRLTYPSGKPSLDFDWDDGGRLIGVWHCDQPDP